MCTVFQYHRGDVRDVARQTDGCTRHEGVHEEGIRLSIIISYIILSEPRLP